MADGGTGEGGEGGGEGGELTPPGASFIQDPNLQHTIDLGYGGPVCGQPTTDPSRYTVHVPTEHTVFSLGEGSPKWIKDAGITGRTKKHIHFHVKDEAKTFLTMGGPSMDAGVCSWTGDTIAASNDGFSMVTEGHAWQESKERHTITSAEAEIHLKAPGKEGDIIMQSDQAAVFAFAKEIGLASKESVAIGAHADAKPSDLKYKQTFTNQWWPTRFAKVGSAIVTALEVVTGIKAIVRATRKHLLEGETDKPGIEESKPGPSVKLGVDIALTASTIGRAIAEFKGKEVGQSVGISADNFVGVTAGIGATMYGTVSSAIVSSGQAEVLGGASALLKAIGWTEIAGHWSALTAVKDVEIDAAKGEVVIGAEEHVKITAKSGKMLITAKENVQLVSTELRTTVWGEKSVLVGSKGYAFQATEHELTFGMNTAPTNFAAPAFDATNLFRMNKDETACFRGKAGFAIRDNKVTLTTNGRVGELVLDGDNVKVVGNRILLGA